MTVSVRLARAGNGDGVSGAWRAQRPITPIDPGHFQVPTAVGLVDLFDSGINCA
jgi:hypothetical protein